jgi:hypothetical protein
MVIVAAKADRRIVSSSHRNGGSLVAVRRQVYFWFGQKR